MKHKPSLSAIFITVFIDLMGFGVLIPILPTFASKDLAISDFGIGIIVAVYSLMQFLFNPVLGSLSDKYGRRPFILLSLFTTGVSYIIFSFSTTFLVLLLSRMLAGIGGSNIGVAQAYIADVTTKEERAKGMGIIGAAFGLGFVFGPMIGGILSHYGYPVVGFASAAFSFTAFIYSFFFLPESNLTKQKEIKINYRLIDFKKTIETIKHPDVGILVILYFIIVFSMANIYGTFSLLGYKVYSFSDRQIGYLFGIIGIVGAVVQGGLIKTLSKRFSDKSLIVSGAFLMMIGLGLLPYGGTFSGVAMVAIVLGFGTAISQPVILGLISKLTSEKEQGSILGMNSSLGAFARVMGPLWGGFAFQFFGYQFPFLTGALFTLITFLLTLFFVKTNKTLIEQE